MNVPEVEFLTASTSFREISEKKVATEKGEIVMAIIDYGAIAFKNGKLISTEMFTPMEETCGFSDKQNILPGTDHSFDGNHFVTIGNRQFIVGFYKESVSWCFDHGKTWNENRYEGGVELVSWSDYHGWTRWEKSFSTFRQEREITVKPRNGYYVAKVIIETDTYKVFFGCGVDLNFYKRTGRVNYYRSPEYYVQHYSWEARTRLKRTLDRFRGG